MRHLPSSKYSFVCLISYRSRRPDPPPTRTCCSLICCMITRQRPIVACKSVDPVVNSWPPSLEKLVVKIPKTILELQTIQALTLARVHYDLPQVPLDDEDP